MNTVKRQLALLAMSLGGMFGQFGDIATAKGQQRNGSFAVERPNGLRGGKSGQTKRDPRQRMRAKSGHGRKMHRRSYLSGKPGLRHI